MNNKRPGGYVVLTCSFHQENNKWVGTCLELGTSTFGRSLSDVDKKLQEAITLHLNTLEDVGECESFFTEHHIVFHETMPRNIRIPITRTTDNSFFRSSVHKIGELVTA